MNMAPCTFDSDDCSKLRKKCAFSHTNQQACLQCSKQGLTRCHFFKAFIPGPSSSRKNVPEELVGTRAPVSSETKMKEVRAENGLTVPSKPKRKKMKKRKRKDHGTPHPICIQGTQKKTKSGTVVQQTFCANPVLQVGGQNLITHCHDTRHNSCQEYTQSADSDDE